MNPQKNVPIPPVIPPTVPTAPPPAPVAPSTPEEAQARSKFSCPACGAEARWNPAKQALLCGYCGTESPATLESTPSGDQQIRENDLVAALRSIPDHQRGWKATKTQVRCQHCNAISVFDPEKIGKQCDFCGAAALVPYEEVKESFMPESLLPKQISETQVRDTVRQWYKSRWFAPNALGTRALTDTVHGVYLPYWTFDAHASAQWTAESGYYYYVTEHYTDAQGNRRSRQVRKIRWQSSAGSLRHFFDDELVAATKGVQPDLLRKVEPFPTKKLVPYDPGFLAGWTVERYQIDLIAAAQRARQSMDNQVRQLCAAQVPGDTHRNLRVSTQWSGQTFKHILVPVWLLTYDYHRKSYQVVVNGFTGDIAGNRPYSFWKIFFLVVGILVAVGLLALLAQGGSR
jgi:hypothetical protein